MLLSSVLLSPRATLLGALAITAALQATPASAAAACEGPQLDYRGAVALFAPGTDTVVMGEADGTLTSRVCHPVTGCAAAAPVAGDKMTLWKDGSSPYYWQSSYAVSRHGQFGLHAGLNGDVTLVFLSDPATADSQERLQVNCRMKPGATSFSSCWAIATRSESFAPHAGQFDAFPSFTHPTCSIYGCYSSASRVSVDPSSVRLTASCASMRAGNATYDWSASAFW